MAHLGTVGTATQNSSSSSVAVTLTDGVPVGATILLGIAWDAPAPGSIPTISSVVDTSGNTWSTTPDVSRLGNDTVAVAALRAQVTTALDAGDTITVTISAPRARWAMQADAFDDIADTSPLDKTASNDGVASSLSSGTTAATAEASELVYSLFGFGGGRDVTIPDGWSGGPKVETTAGSANRALQVIHRYVASTGTQEGTLTLSSSSTYAAGIATYKLEAEAHSGSATMTAALGMTAAGSPDVDGAGQVTATLGMTAAGSPDVAGGTGLITGQLAMSARGRADTSIGLPPRPRVRWQFVAGPAAGGHELALTAATSRRYTARLTAASELSFSINARNPQAGALDELRTDVHVLYTDDTGQTRILDRCRVGTTSDNLDADSHRLDVTCLDYREVLNRRRLYEGAPLTYTGVDQAEIAWSLIDYTQGLPGGDLGISKGWTGTTPTGRLRDRTYEVRDSIGERIQELSEVIDGFDWDIVPTSPSGLAFQVWYPQRGADRGVVLEYGGLVAAVRREVNPSEYANAIQYTGSTDPATTPVTVEAADLATRPEGRWDAAFGDDGLITQATLEDRAAWQLSQSEVITPVYTLTLRRGAWRGPDHLWLGDPVRLVIMSGRLRVNTVLRVHELQINIDDDGRETVEVTVGGPRPDYRRRATEFDRRLANLERR